MLTFKVIEDEVYQLLPAATVRPDYVPANNKGGVTRAGYDAIEARYNAYIRSQLKKASVPVVSYSDINDVPQLLKDAQVHMIAAAILRIFDNPQNPYKDLYATGNIFLRAYIEEYQLDNQTALEAPEFVVDADVDLTQYSFDGLI